MEILQRGTRKKIRLSKINRKKLNPKLSRFEHNEEFIAMLREEQRLWDVMSTLKRDNNENDKSLKIMSDEFQSFSDGYFRI